MTRRRSKAKVIKPRPAVAPGHLPICDAAPSLLRPWLLAAMTALFVARPLFPSESAATHGDGLMVVMLWIGVAVFWMLGAVGHPKLMIRFGRIDVAVGVLMLCFAAASLWAVRHGSPRPAVNVLWEWLGMGLAFFLARQLIATPREMRALVAVMVGLAVAISAYAIYQWAYDTPGLLTHYDKNPDAALREAGLWFPPDSPERKLFRDRLASNLPGGTFALSNSLAGFVAPWLVILAGIAWTSLRSRRRLLGVGLCAAVLTTCLVLTRSRSGCIAAAIGLLLIWSLTRRRFRFGLRSAVVIAVVLAAAAALGTVFHQRLADASKSLGYRVQYWQASLHMIADHPWLGCGPGNFQDAYTRYKLPEASEEVADPHNFLLEIWATAGTPAALAFLVVLMCFARPQNKQGPGTSGPSSTAGKSPTAPPTTDAWPYVLAGGGLGFLLSVPLGMVTVAPPGLIPVLMGLPLAAMTVAILLAWVRDGTMPEWLPGVAVVVLLLDLLAAGGIGLPGVAGTLWLLLCLGTLARDSYRKWSAWPAWVGLATAVVLLTACYSSAYNPVFACQTHLRMAERKEGAAAVHELEAAAAADPLSAEPWRLLASAWFDEWEATRNQADFRRFELADANVHRLAPNRAPDWLNSADWYFRAAAMTDADGKIVMPEALEWAVETYRQAARLYPNSALYRAKLAEAYAAAGDRSAFGQEAEAALQLDQLTPHADKKLPSALRNRLVQRLRSAN